MSGYGNAAAPSGGYGVPAGVGTEVKDAAAYGIPAAASTEVKDAAAYGIPAGTGTEVKDAASYQVSGGVGTEVKDTAPDGIPVGAGTEVKDAVPYQVSGGAGTGVKDPASYPVSGGAGTEVKGMNAKDDQTKDKDSELKPKDDEPVEKENPVTRWIKEVYDKLDKDGDGQVTKQEMKEALQNDSIKKVFSRCGVEDEEAAMQLLLKADRGGNEDGKMSFNEFEKVFVRAIFNAVDKDGSGGVDRKELQEYYHGILTKQRPDKTNTQNRKTAYQFATRKVAGKYDDSKDGVLQFEEFHEMMKLSTMLKPDVNTPTAK